MQLVSVDVQQLKGWGGFLLVCNIQKKTYQNIFERELEEIWAFSYSCTSFCLVVFNIYSHQNLEMYLYSTIIKK